MAEADELQLRRSTKGWLVWQAVVLAESLALPAKGLVGFRSRGDAIDAERLKLSYRGGRGRVARWLRGGLCGEQQP